jgi:hypothetical protein
MTEFEKLTSLRDKFVASRRLLVSSLLAVNSDRIATTIR